MIFKFSSSLNDSMTLWHYTNRAGAKVMHAKNPLCSLLGPGYSHSLVQGSSSKATASEFSKERKPNRTHQNPTNQTRPPKQTTQPAKQTTATKSQQQKQTLKAIPIECFYCRPWGSFPWMLAKMYLTRREYFSHKPEADVEVGYRNPFYQGADLNLSPVCLQTDRLKLITVSPIRIMFKY